MAKAITAALVVVMSIGSISCRKQGFREVALALHAMQDLKTFRVSVTEGPHSATADYVCPDGVRSVEKDQNNGVETEQIAIGNRIFARDGSNGSWREEPVKKAPYPTIPACVMAVTQATGGSFGAMAALTSERPKEPKYMGQELVGEQKCDSWGIPQEDYAVYHPGQFRDPTPHWAAIVCIDPANHRILQSKRDNLVLRFFDFNQNITVHEPEVSGTEQRSRP